MAPSVLLWRGRAVAIWAVWRCLDQDCNRCGYNIPFCPAVVHLFKVCAQRMAERTSLELPHNTVQHQLDISQQGHRRLLAAGATGLLDVQRLLPSLRAQAASSQPSTCLQLVQQQVQQGVCSWEVLQAVFEGPEQFAQALHIAAAQEHLQQLLQEDDYVAPQAPTSSCSGSQSAFAAIVLQLLLDESPSGMASHGAALPWLQAPAAWSSFAEQALRALHQAAHQDGVLLLELARVVGECVMPLAPELAARWFLKQLGALLQPVQAPTTLLRSERPSPLPSSILVDPQVCAGFLSHALQCCSVEQLWQQHLGAFLAAAGLQGPAQLLVAATVLVVLLRCSSTAEDAVLTQVAASLWQALQQQEPRQLVAWLLLLRRCLPMDAYRALLRDSCSRRIQELCSSGGAAAAAAELLLAALDAATPGAHAEVLRVHQQLAQELRPSCITSHQLLDKLQQLRDLLKVALAEQVALHAAAGGMAAAAPSTTAGVPAVSQQELQQYVEQYQQHMRQGLPALPGSFYMFRPVFARLQPLLLQPPPDAAAARLRGDFIQALVTCKPAFLPPAVWQEYQQVCWALGLPISSKEPAAAAAPLRAGGPPGAGMPAGGDARLAALLDRLEAAAASQSAAAVRVLLSRLSERLQVLLTRISSDTTPDQGQQGSGAPGLAKRRKLSLHHAASSHAPAAGAAGGASKCPGSAAAAGSSQVSAGALAQQLLDGWVQLCSQTAAAGGAEAGGAAGSCSVGWQQGYLGVLAGAGQLHRHLALQLLQWMQHQQQAAAGATHQQAVKQLLALMASCVCREQPIAGSEVIHQVVQPQYCWDVPPVLYSVSAGAAAMCAGGHQQQQLQQRLEVDSSAAAAQAVAHACPLHQGSAAAAQHTRPAESDLMVHSHRHVQQVLQQAHVDIMRRWVQQLSAVDAPASGGAASCCRGAGMPGWQLVQLLWAAAVDSC